MYACLSLTVVLLFFTLTAGAQDPAPALGTGPSTKPKKLIENVESKVDCLPITDIRNDRDGLLTVKVRNLCEKEIVVVLPRFGNASQFGAARGMKPDAEQEIKATQTGYGMEKGMRIEAVLFKDGTGSGMPNKVRSLSMLFAGSRSELEKIIGFIDSLTSSPPIDPQAVISEFKRRLEELPEFYADLTEVKLGGTLLMNGRLMYLGHIAQIPEEKLLDADYVLAELLKYKSEMQKILDGYPN